MKYYKEIFLMVTEPKYTCNYLPIQIPLYCYKKNEILQNITNTYRADEYIQGGPQK